MRTSAMKSKICSLFQVINLWSHPRPCNSNSREIFVFISFNYVCIVLYIVYNQMANTYNVILCSFFSSIFSGFSQFFFFFTSYLYLGNFQFCWQRVTACNLSFNKNYKNRKRFGAVRTVGVFMKTWLWWKGQLLFVVISFRWFLRTSPPWPRCLSLLTTEYSPHTASGTPGSVSGRQVSFLLPCPCNPSCRYLLPSAHTQWGRVFMEAKVAFHLSVLAGRKELVLASVNGTVQGARVHFSRHNSPDSRALADRSGRTERLWSMIRDILARTSFENSCVHLKNWLVGPTGPDK